MSRLDVQLVSLALGDEVEVALLIDNPGSGKRWTIIAFCESSPDADILCGSRVYRVPREALRLVGFSQTREPEISPAIGPLIGFVSFLIAIAALGAWLR